MLFCEYMYSTYLCAVFFDSMAVYSTHAEVVHIFALVGLFDWIGLAAVWRWWLVAGCSVEFRAAGVCEVDGWTLFSFSFPSHQQYLVMTIIVHLNSVVTLEKGGSVSPCSAQCQWCPGKGVQCQLLHVDHGY